MSAKDTDVTGGAGTSENKSVSASGRFVAFESTASDLATVNDNNGVEDISVRDRQDGVTITVSVNHAGTAIGNSRPPNPVISGDGRFVVFLSLASDLSPLDIDNVGDAYLFFSVIV